MESHDQLFAFKLLKTYVKLCYFNYQLLIKNFIFIYFFKIKSLKEDLKFHKSVYDLQLEYIQSLFEAVK